MISVLFCTAELPAKQLRMFKKTVLTLAFLTIFNSFCGFKARSDSAASASAVLGATHSLLLEGEYAISAYDELMRSICEEEGHDWRLMSAIAYQESRFRSDLTSRRGARGLMQIMPSVARQFGVPVEAVADPALNIRVANQLMSHIIATLIFADGTSSRDRLSIILASYNGGLGHVVDARRLARAFGENPDSWEVVARYLELKAEPDYYQSEEVRCGRFSGSAQTLAYVDNVVGRYYRYCRIAAR